MVVLVSQCRQEKDLLSLRGAEPRGDPRRGPEARRSGRYHRRSRIGSRPLSRRDDTAARASRGTRAALGSRCGAAEPSALHHPRWSQPATTWRVAAEVSKAAPSSGEPKQAAATNKQTSQAPITSRFSTKKAAG